MSRAALDDRALGEHHEAPMTEDATDDLLRDWLAEAKRRLEDIRSGRESTVPAAEVFRKGRALIEQRSRDRQ